jgi:hypothetical protein
LEQNWLRTFKNGALKKVPGPRRDEETLICGKLHNEGLLNIFNPHHRLTKSRPKWEGHVERMGKTEVHAKVLVEKRE